MKFLKSLFAMLLLFTVALTVEANNGSKIEKHETYSFSEVQSPAVEFQPVYILVNVNQATDAYTDTEALTATQNNSLYFEPYRNLIGRVIYRCPKINSKYHCEWLINPNKTC
jgi:hypothetical protein